MPYMINNFVTLWTKFWRVIAILSFHCDNFITHQTSKRGIAKLVTLMVEGYLNKVMKYNAIHAP